MRIVTLCLKKDQSYSLSLMAWGGHNAGEVASRVAVDAVKDFISEQLSGEASKDQVEEVLLGSIRHANAKVYELSRSNSDMEGMAQH